LTRRFAPWRGYADESKRFSMAGLDWPVPLLILAAALSDSFCGGIAPCQNRALLSFSGKLIS